MKTKVSQVETYKSLVPALFTVIFLLLGQVAYAQEAASNQNANQKRETPAAKTAATNSNTVATIKPATSAPVFTDYKGIHIGMSAHEVRDKLDHLKEKGEVQDVFIFSDAESAQVYYDAQGKVMAISVIYMGDDSNAPKPQAVLGEGVQAKPDGSIYELKRYPEAGYWVAYSRTAGKNPIITVTMNKMK
ncbi:MAG TPA: hypothetical protein VF766_09770 [Pyrinomonadaceae bacterium]